MINHDVATALRAVTTITHLAALELSQELLAFRDLHVLRFPQREYAHRRGGIAPAVFAMTITHIERLTARFDLDRSAVTSCFVRL